MKYGIFVKRMIAVTSSVTPKAPKDHRRQPKCIILFKWLRKTTS